MDQRLQKISSIKLHYRHGKATVEFYDNESGDTIHSHKKPVNDLYEVFIFYKAYERFVAEKGWHLIAAHLADMYGVSIEGKSVEQVTQEIRTVQQKLYKEMDVYV